MSAKLTKLAKHIYQVFFVVLVVFELIVTSCRGSKQVL